MLDRKVEPTKALFFKPMACEKQTAYLHNCAVDEAAKTDVAMIAYRYLQTRNGERNSRNEAILFGIVILCILVPYINNVFLTNENEGVPDKDILFSTTLLDFALKLCTPFLPLFGANMLPNMKNATRYNLTNEECKNWLIKHKGMPFFKKLEKLPYSHPGKERLCALLEEEGIEHSHLRTKCDIKSKALNDSQQTIQVQL